MANPISALQAARRIGRFGTTEMPWVTIEEITGFGLLQFAAWASTLAETGAEAARVAGCSASPAPGQSVRGANGTLLRVEPLKWWLLVPAVAKTPDPELAPQKGAVLDLLQSRCWLRISGSPAETLLNHFLPLNLGSGAFPAGAVAITAFHHTGVTLWRDVQGLNLLMPRSTARSLWELLSESARQYGLAEK
ncbi:sarcosine oxidase subunit gamma [Leisingera aquimarina]|uniref:sarcosine oxidase subunit gamma n=1 Tax=Leisingera aquimarina TaxID=476529 RepID=UPI00041F5B04|nr:hypothetical protein [Leisingera aquimarina]